MQASRWEGVDVLDRQTGANLRSDDYTAWRLVWLGAGSVF